jgi:hypothetical protein
MNAEQVISSAAQVINFAETKKKPRSVRKAKQSDHPDAELIECCMEYAAQIKIAEVGYLIDPTDSEFAEFADNLAQSRARRAMTQLLDLAPTTMDGLRAKAAIVAICIEDWNGAIEGIPREFVVSLAEDVIRFQRASVAMKQNDVPLEVPA